MRVRQFVRKGKTRVFFTMGEVDVFNRYSLISFFFFLTFLRARKIIFFNFLTGVETYGQIRRRRYSERRFLFSDIKFRFRATFRQFRPRNQG